MKLTVKQLRRLIKEEVQTLLETNDNKSSMLKPLIALIERMTSKSSFEGWSEVITHVAKEKYNADLSEEQEASINTQVNEIFDTLAEKIHADKDGFAMLDFGSQKALRTFISKLCELGGYEREKEKKLLDDVILGRDSVKRVQGEIQKDAEHAQQMLKQNF